jgi:hypothetical protein
MRFLRIVLPLAMCFAVAIGSARAAVLYVADVGADAVFGYPLTRGIPASVPTTTLLLTYMPLQLAMAPDGALYVENAAERRVDVYAQGASGHAHSMRTIELPYVPQAIATDVEGYLYVADPTSTVDIYAPTARRHAKPVAHVPLGSLLAGITSLALDASGRLFAGGGGPGGITVVEYANPRGSSVFVRSLKTFSQAPLEMAVDATGELYLVDIYTRVYTYEPAAIACCLFLYPFDRQPAPQAQSFYLVGIALDARHAFLISAGKSVAPTIYTVDMLRGPQTPLSVVTGANLKTPAYVVVGT